MQITRNSMVSFIRGLHDPQTARDLPASKIDLLRNPLIYKAGLEELEDSFLEGLIKQNILRDAAERREQELLHVDDKDDTVRHEFLKAHIDAVHIRALYNSFSLRNRPRFSRLVKAFDIAIKRNPKFREMLEDIQLMVPGGEIRIVATAGPITLAMNLLRALGIKPKKFYGQSAGSLVACGLAFGAPPSIVLTNTLDTDFKEITSDRKLFEAWINNCLKQGYCYTTGKQEHELGDITGEHLDEIGNDLQVLVSEFTRYVKPKLEAYFLPRELKERFGLNPRNFKLAKAIAASGNLAGLFFYPWDLTFGRCSIRDSKGFLHYLLDAGLDRENQIPSGDLEAGIEAYNKRERELPPFAFIFGTRRFDQHGLLNDSSSIEVLTDKIAEELAGRSPSSTKVEKRSLSERIADTVISIIDLFFINPVEKLRGLGAGRLYLEAACGVKDRSAGGKTVMLKLRNLNPPVHVREVLNSANLPTSDYDDLTDIAVGEESQPKPALDQFCDSFVDDEYVDSNGERGKSPFDLYIDDVDKSRQKDSPDTIRIGEASRSIVAVRNVLKGRTAATL